jgi:TENA/THI-4/PQQC family
MTLLERPLLSFPTTIDGADVVVERDGTPYVVAVDGFEPGALHQLLGLMDGTRSVDELAHEVGDGDVVGLVVTELDRNALLDDSVRPTARSGLDVLLELEDLANDLHERILYDNVFWATLRNPPENLNRNVMYGFCIENYHFLFREAYFDSPVLSYQPSTRVRLIMNEFYAEEHGHDEILLKALNSLGSIGISRDDLADTMPLPGTMALCNALAWWATTDPIFFFTTLGVLEGKDIHEGEEDFFLEACDQLGMDASFVKPIRTHANINRDGGHGNLTRAIFREVHSLDPPTVRRLRGQTHMFYELYSAFYTNVWDFYSTNPTLLRRVSAL